MEQAAQNQAPVEQYTGSFVAAPEGQSTESDVPVPDAPNAQPDADVPDAPARPKAFSIARIDAIVLKLWQKVNDKEHELIADIEKMLGL